MIIDWRSKRYRGGSRWWSAAVFAISVGVSLAPSIVGTGDIIAVQAEDRTVVVTDDRTIAVPIDGRTILCPTRPTP